MPTLFSSKSLYIVFFILLLVVAGNGVLGAQVPSSKRSKAAAGRVLPKLQKQFKDKGLKLGNPVFIRIFKQTDELELWVKNGSQYSLFKTYPICYFSGGLGSKKKEGDRKAPEGFYNVPPGRMNPNSSYHLSFDIGYPNAYDKAHAYTGSAICVHGNCVSIGCYAMTDKLIEEIFTIMAKAYEGEQAGIPVHIFPFRMTDDKLKRYKGNEWYAFWTNLQEGYKLFESTKVPPPAKVKNKKYVFN